MHLRPPPRRFGNQARPFRPLISARSSGLPTAALPARLRNTLLWYESTVHALRALSHGLCAAAALALGVWAIWLARGNLWTSENTARWSAELDCDSRADMREGYEICAAVLILWTAPLCVGGASLLFAVSLALLGRTLARTTQWVRGMVKAVIALVILLTLGLYVAAAIGGAGMGMARQVFFVIGATLFGLLLVGGVVIGRKALRTELITQPLYRSLIEMLDSDGARATLLYIGAPLIVGGAVLSALNQLTRRLTRFYFYQPICFYSRRPSLAGQQGPLRTYGPCTALLTPTFADRFNALGEWSWTPLLLIICYLAIGCWALLYGTTLSYMVFAVCINILKSMHWVLASIIFFLFGQVMFLIPVVPGLAVYMCAGVLLVPACEQPFGGGSRGFWLAVAYASVLSFLMKLVAHVLQQKVVGETMGSSAKVRAEVGINSLTMKGIRHVLEQPGLSVGKCAIFLGGPDWPTSVLCGILKLNLCRMLLALQPIIVLSVPSTMAGAFQLKTDDGDVWASAASVSLALCSLIMLVAGLVAMYYIEDAKAHHKAALRAYEDDAEVAALEEEEKALKERFAEATELSKMPPLPLLQLLCATATLALSSYGLMFASSACFENFSLTDDIADVLCVSCPRAAVKPAGWIALAMLGVGIFCLVRFNEWSEQATMLTLTPSPSRRRISVQDGRISLV